MPEYQRFNLEVDSQERTQTRDQRIARITSLYQSGAVRADVAREAIAKLSRGEYVAEIETMLLQVEPLEAVNWDNAVHRERAEAAAEKAVADAALVKQQGLLPRGKPTI